MKRLLLICFLTISLHAYAPELDESTKEDKEINKQYEYLMNAEFSEENLYNLLNILWDAQYTMESSRIYLPPDIIDKIMRQSIVETGKFTSPLFKNHDNLFGMHYPLKRESYSYEYTIADKGRKVSSYGSWQSSVLDFILYLDYYISRGYNYKEYYKFLLDVGYCELGERYIYMLKNVS